MHTLNKYMERSSSCQMTIASIAFGRAHGSQSAGVQVIHSTPVSAVLSALFHLLIGWCDCPSPLSIHGPVKQDVRGSSA